MMENIQKKQSLVSGKNRTGLLFAQAARAFTFLLQVKKVNQKPVASEKNLKIKDFC